MLDKFLEIQSWFLTRDVSDKVITHSTLFGSKKDLTTETGQYFTRFECSSFFTRFECSSLFTRFECSSLFTRFECSSLFTRFECSFAGKWKISDKYDEQKQLFENLAWLFKLGKLHSF